MFPLVAVTRMLVVPLWWVAPAGLLPPQPDSIATPRVTKTHMQTAPAISRRPLDIRKANRADSMSPTKPAAPFHEDMPAELVVVFGPIVRFVLNAPDAGRLPCEGLKLHVMPSGSPTQAKLTCPANAETEETVNLTGVDCAPSGTSTLLAERETAMS
jgi:hypothetical protein